MKHIFFNCLAVCFVCISPFLLHAQDSLHIQILEKNTGETLPALYVNVYAGNPDKMVTQGLTDVDGKVALPLPSFPCHIEVLGIGFETQYTRLLENPGKPIQIRLTRNFATLKEFVVTGVARPVKPQDALSLYRVINAGTFQSQGAVNLQDVMKFQMNTDVGNDQMLGSTIRMQGMSGNKVKILIDGLPVNGREAGNVDLGQLNLYNVERIEMVQGPMSVMYGTDALGGVINLISKNLRKPWELSANAFYESSGKYNLTLSGTRSWKKHHVTLGGGRNYFEGWNYSASDTVAPKKRQRIFRPKEQYMANLNYGYTAASGFKLRLASDFVHEKMTNHGPVQIYDHFLGVRARDEYYYTTRSMNRIFMEGKLGKTGRWQVSNAFSYYNRIRNSYNKDLVHMTETLTTTPGDQDTSRFNEITLRGSYDNKVKWFDYAIGYDVNLQYGKSQKIPDGLKDMHDFAGYLSLSMPIWNEKLIAQGGFRASYNSAYQSPVIPSVHLLYHTTKNIKIRASYAKGFRAPSLKEMYLLFFDLNHELQGNPNLKAEQGNHYQASASWMVFEKKASFAQILLAGYYNEVNNQIGLASVGDPNRPNWYTYVNILKQRNAIVNLELEGQYHNFNYKLGYSFMHVYAEAGYNQAFSVQEYVASLQYLWKKPGLKFSLFNKLTGAQPALVENIDGSSSYSGKRPAYNMMDFSLSKKFRKQNIQLTAGVKNIFNVLALTSSGVITNSSHVSAGNISFLPRSVFTSIQFTLD
jgi:outer membrane receptor for ferrienterochelin and colicins